MRRHKILFRNNKLLFRFRFDWIASGFVNFMIDLEKFFSFHGFLLGVPRPCQEQCISRIFFFSRLLARQPLESGSEVGAGRTTALFICLNAGSLERKSRSFFSTGWEFIVVQRTRVSCQEIVSTLDILQRTSFCVPRDGDEVKCF